MQKIVGTIRCLCFSIDLLRVRKEEGTGNYSQKVADSIPSLISVHEMKLLGITITAHAVISGAVISGAVISGAVISGAVISGAVIIHGSVVHGSVIQW